MSIPGRGERDGQKDATLGASGSSQGGASSPGRRLTIGTAVVVILVIGGLFLGIRAHAHLAATVATMARSALWLLPLLMALHLVQLLLCAIAWRDLLPRSRISLLAFYRLRVLREGIDCLLPVAHIGGEVVATQLLSRAGLALPVAAASVIVDVTVELLMQMVFLLTALGVLALVGGSLGGSVWVKLLVAGAIGIGGFVLAQALGVLRMLETLSRGIARRFPSLSGVSLAGLQEALEGIYRQGGPMLRGSIMHLAAWVIGSLESWAILHAIGFPVSLAQGFVVESLGMAGRSAGFAIPAALGAQEGGYFLACAAIGVAGAPSLALSIVKRLREVLVALVGLGLWRIAATGPRVAGTPGSLA